VSSKEIAPPPHRSLEKRLFQALYFIRAFSFCPHGNAEGRLPVLHPPRCRLFRDRRCNGLGEILFSRHLLSPNFLAKRKSPQKDLAILKARHFRDMDFLETFAYPGSRLFNDWVCIRSQSWGTRKRIVSSSNLIRARPTHAVVAPGPLYLSLFIAIVALSIR